jgi:MoaA/NifB/PqqE/SkfB family radical SAM enzyme
LNQEVDAMQPPTFRIDVAVHDLLTKSPGSRSAPAPGDARLPAAVFPHHPERLAAEGPEHPPERRAHDARWVYRLTRTWLIPYLRSRVLAGDFHPITAYLFLEYKCNLDCWYCWSFNNKIRGMTEDIARRSIDWLYSTGCRVLALIGGEPLLRPAFVHNVVDYAAKKGFWIYIGTNGRLLTPDLADRLGDAGVGVFNLAVDAWDVKPGLPKALGPVRANMEHLLRKQYVYDYMVFFNINICRNNVDDVRRVTEYAHERRIATDYHVNETPLLEQDAHFGHLSENPTYIRPGDWREIDALIDWLIEKNRVGYQMVNSVRRLQEMKSFVRMGSGVDLKACGWNGDGTGDLRLDAMPGVVEDRDGCLRFAEWNCRAGQNNVVIRTDGTITPCFPMYDATVDWGAIEAPRIDRAELASLKRTCQRHCFSTLNHNLAYCYDDARIVKWLVRQAMNGFQGGARSMEE